MSDHDRYRDHPSGWEPFYASANEIFIIGAIQCDMDAPTQPIGFRPAPGRSRDRRGLPRIRVKAVGIKVDV